MLEMNFGFKTYSNGKTFNYEVLQHTNTLVKENSIEMTSMTKK